MPTCDQIQTAQSESDKSMERLSQQIARMLETRLEAAQLVVEIERDRLLRQLRLQLFGVLALGTAVWVGIVLLAVILPPGVRGGVLAGALIACLFGFGLSRATLRSAQRDESSAPYQRLLRALRADLGAVAAALDPPPTQEGAASRAQPTRASMNGGGVDAQH